MLLKFILVIASGLAVIFFVGYYACCVLSGAADDKIAAQNGGKEL